MYVSIVHLKFLTMLVTLVMAKAAMKVNKDLVTHGELQIMTCELNMQERLEIVMTSVVEVK